MDRRKFIFQSFGALGTLLLPKAARASSAHSDQDSESFTIGFSHADEVDPMFPLLSYIEMQARNYAVRSLLEPYITFSKSAEALKVEIDKFLAAMPLTITQSRNTAGNVLLLVSAIRLLNQEEFRTLAEQARSAAQRETPFPSSADLWSEFKSASDALKRGLMDLDGLNANQAEGLQRVLVQSSLLEGGRIRAQNSLSSYQGTLTSIKQRIENIRSKLEEFQISCYDEEGRPTATPSIQLLNDVLQLLESPDLKAKPLVEVEVNALMAPNEPDFRAILSEAVCVLRKQVTGHSFAVLNDALAMTLAQRDLWSVYYDCRRALHTCGAVASNSSSLFAVGTTCIASQLESELAKQNYIRIAINGAVKRPSVKMTQLERRLVAISQQIKVKRIPSVSV